MWRALSIVVALVSSVHAQPTPPPGATPTAPAPAPTYWRFTLSDGRVLDVLVVGGDASSYFIQTPQGVYSIARATVVYAVPLVWPAPPATPPMYQPVQPPAHPTPAVSPPADKETQEKHEAVADARRARVGGIGFFGASYGLAVLSALYNLERGDPTGAYAFIPFAGPVIASAINDEGEYLLDGWNWVAMVDAAVQVIGVSAILIGTFEGRKARAALEEKPASSFLIQPVASPSFSGIVFGGRI